MKSALLEQLTAKPAKVEKLDLGLIVTRGLQTRETTDAAKVAEYAELYRAAAALPPIVVFRDEDDTHHLADGHHRLAAARKAELTEIDALIHRGDRRDALWYSAAANAQHGLPRTNADKRKAAGILLADAEWRLLSDAVLAQHLQVSDRFVGKVRKELGAQAETVTGRDGKARKVAKKPAKTATPNRTETAASNDLGRDLDRCIRQAAAMFAHPPAGPTSDDVECAADYLGIDLGAHWFNLGIDGIQQDRDGGWHTLREDDATTAAELDDRANPQAGNESTADTATVTAAVGPQYAGPEEIAAPTDPAPPARQKNLRPLGLRRVDAQRDLIAVELTTGKPRWTGTDRDLLLLALICGVPTTCCVWTDQCRAQALDLFTHALAAEVAARIRSGEAIDGRRWPCLAELCRLWGLDFAALEIRAERVVPE